MTHGNKRKGATKFTVPQRFKLWSSGSMTSEATRGKEKPFSQTRVCLWSTRKTHQGSTPWSLKQRELDGIWGKMRRNSGIKWPRCTERTKEGLGILKVERNFVAFKEGRMKIPTFANFSFMVLSFCNSHEPWMAKIPCCCLGSP